MSKLARMPDGKTLRFPDDTPDEVIEAAVKKYMGVEDAGGQAQQPSLMDKINTSLPWLQPAIGAGKGLLSSATNLARMNPVIGPGMNVASPKNPDWMMPTNAEQESGFTAEQMLEYIIPAPGANAPKAMSSVSKAAQIVRAAARELPRAAGRNAIATSTVAAAHGKSPSEIVGEGLVGGGTGVVGELIATAGRLGAPWLKAGAEKLYDSALHATKSVTKQYSKTIVPELLARREWFTSLGSLMERAQGEMDEAVKLMDDYYARHGGDMIDTAPLVASLEKIKNQFRNRVVEITQQYFPSQTGMGLGVTKNVRRAKVINIDGGAIAATDDLINVIKKHGDSVSLDSLRKVKQIWFDAVTKANQQWVGRPLTKVTDPYIQREGSFALLRELNKRYPELKKINAEFTFWKRTADVVRETTARKVGQQSPLYEGIATIAGAASGEAIPDMLLKGAGAKMFVKAIRSPMWKTFAAVQKQRLADALWRGNVKEVNNILGKFMIGLHQTQPPKAEQEENPVSETAPVYKFDAGTLIPS